MQWEIDVTHRKYMMKTFVLILIISMPMDAGITGVEMNLNTTMTLEVGGFETLEACMEDRAVKIKDLDLLDKTVEVKKFDCIEKMPG